MERPYPKLNLKRGRDLSLRRGHPWLFSGAVASVTGGPAAGQVVCALSASGDPLGLGFYHPGTDICFRLLTRNPAISIDGPFWADRIRSAQRLRQDILPAGTSAYRLINAEGDGMPGLVADRYGDSLVVSFTTAGMDQCRPFILDALEEAVRPLGILERSTGRSRQLEGLPDRLGVVRGEAPPPEVDILENGLAFSVDIITGQKTGFFLDQRDNRARLQDLSRDKAVLNCFSYSGAFTVYCARGGAQSVTSVETSAAANQMARKHLEQNGIPPDRHPIVQEDAFRFLRETPGPFDLIILDPPAFAKSRRDIPGAARGYKEINRQAMRVLGHGGLLATFSCSNAIDESLFARIVLGAAQDAGRSARLLQAFGPAADHPTALGHPEGRYLKGMLLHIEG